MGNELQQIPELSTLEYIIIAVFLIIALAIFLWEKCNNIESNNSASESNGASTLHRSRQLMNAFPAPAAAVGVSSARLIPRERAFPAPAAPGLSAAQLMALGSFKYTKSAHESEVECSICLSAMADDEEVRRLPNCSHYFHKGCIGAWLSLKPTCPLCLTTVVVGPAPQEQPQQNRVVFVARQQQPAQLNIGIIL